MHESWLLYSESLLKDFILLYIHQRQLIDILQVVYLPFMQKNSPFETG